MGIFQGQLWVDNSLLALGGTYIPRPYFYLTLVSRRLVEKARIWNGMWASASGL